MVGSNRYCRCDFTSWKYANHHVDNG